MSDNESEQVSAQQFNELQDEDSVQRQYKQKNQRQFASEEDFFTIQGMFFCSTCKNLLQPTRYNGNMLQFKCKSCDATAIDFKQRQGKLCMLYSKALQAGSRKAIANQNFIFDPTMPRLTVQCPECGYHTAAYLVAADDGQRKMVLKLICLRGSSQGTVKCGQIWELDQTELIYKDTIQQSQQ